MERLNQILEQAKRQKDSGQHSASKMASQVQASDLYTKRFKKFFVENRVPRYMIYAIIAVKMTTIYDKIKQLVAINNIYAQIVQEQRENFRQVFKHDAREESDQQDPLRADGELGSLRATDAELMQDLLTRKILQVNNLDDDDEDLLGKDIVKPDLTGGRRGI